VATKLYVWYGKGSNQIEKDFARSIFSKEGKALVEIEEGSESSEWWNLIGGKEIYPLALKSDRKEARLFACSMGTGVFAVEEVDQFVQDDLLSDDVMILDAYAAVYVWIGPLSTEEERKGAMQTACEYVEAATDGRAKNSPVWRVKSGEEPYVFTTNFHGWDFTKRKSPQSLDSGLERVSEVLAQYSRKYTYQELVDKQYPKGLDGSRLEDFLEDYEFQKVFEMSSEEFAKLPLWKRQKMKKEMGLY